MVRMERCLSDIGWLRSGVAQKSALRPVLSPMYASDATNELRDPCLVFAGVITLLATGKSEAI